MKAQSKVSFCASVYLPPIIIFFIGCLCGVFIGFSGGVQWGTPDCGALSVATIFMSLIAAWVSVQLNPAHSRWLMGFPKAWDMASPHHAQWLAAIELAGSKDTATQ